MSKTTVHYITYTIFCNFSLIFLNFLENCSDIMLPLKTLTVNFFCQKSFDDCNINYLLYKAITLVEVVYTETEIKTHIMNQYISRFI